MLSDQEFRLVELVLGRGHTVSNLAYIHRSCAYDVVIDEGKEGDSSNLDVLTCWMGSRSLSAGWRSPTGTCGRSSACASAVCDTDFPRN